VGTPEAGTRMADAEVGGAAPRYEGRLELTWTNKDKALLTQEDGSYRWVPPTDFRVSEVRLLRDAGSLGQVASNERSGVDNLLYEATPCTH
jgi:adenine-specific DNA-methyltransferase